MYNPFLTNAILFVIILIGIVPVLRRLKDSACEKLMTVFLFVNLAAFLISWALNLCYSGPLFIDFVDFLLHEPVLAPTLAVISAIHLKRFKIKWLVVLLMVLNFAIALFSAFLLWEVFGKSA